MAAIGTQIDSDRRLLDFQNYEEYLDSLVNPVDICYLRSSKTARQVAELGYRSTGETLNEENFYRRLRAVKNLLFPIRKPYDLVSELVKPKSRLMEELALREGSNRLGILSTIIFIRYFNKLMFEESAYIDYRDRLKTENWLRYFSGEKKLSPLKKDLAYYHWRMNKMYLNETGNYIPIIDPEHGLLFKNIHDRRIIAVDPAATLSSQHTARVRIHCSFYEHVILYDHVVTDRVLLDN